MVVNLNPVVFQFLQFTGGGKIAKVRLHLRAGSNTVVAPISQRGWGMGDGGWGWEGGMAYLFPCLSDRGLSQCGGGGGELPHI